MTDQYESPLSSRYASDYMLQLFSQQKRIEVWRKLWISLAKAEHSLGLPITEKQIEELEEEAASKEKELYDLKHELIASQIKLDNTEKSLRTLQQDQQESSRQIVRLETEIRGMKDKK